MHASINASICEAAKAFVTGECVHILNSETEKGDQRKRVNESTCLLAKVGLTEQHALHKALNDQLKKARNL